MKQKNEKKLSVTKIEAAKRQLVTAVRLFFQESDAITIHTLTCAGQEILEVVGKSKGIKSMKQKTLDLARDKEFFLKKMDEAKNFFKHGNRDSNKTIEFSPEYTELVLWDAVQMYYFITQEKVPAFAMYDLWTFSKYPEIFKLPFEQERSYKNALGSVTSENKDWFLQGIDKLEKRFGN